MNKLPKLYCTRYAFYFNDGWEAVWFPVDPAKPRGHFRVAIRYITESGGDSISYPVSGPATRAASEYHIKLSIKNKDLPKK